MSGDVGIAMMPRHQPAILAIVNATQSYWHIVVDLWEPWAYMSIERRQSSENGQIQTPQSLCPRC